MHSSVFEIDPDFFRIFSEHQLENPSTFLTAISKEDEMFLHPLGNYQGNTTRTHVQYLNLGLDMMGQVNQIVRWGFGDWSQVSSFLDFACGYGRFTRHLIQEISPEKVWVSDIYSDAVAFQRDYFGVNGFESKTDPDELQVDRKFDLIFVSSLFSHLPREPFRKWLGKLFSLLTPNGILAFSTKGMDFAPQPAEGMVFRQTSESRSLEGSEYGSACVDEAFVAGEIRHTAPPECPWLRIPHGHNGFQDLYLVSRDPLRDFESLDYESGVYGFVDACRTDSPDKLFLAGWAATPKAQDEDLRVQFFVGDKLLYECTPDRDRPDIVRHLGTDRGLRSGWSCTIPTEGIAPSEWLVVKVVDERGDANLISLDTIESMLRW